MKIRSLSYCVWVYLLILASCNDGDIFPNSEIGLIVEGWAEAGQSPHVRLTTSVNLTNNYQSLDSLEKHIIRYANVSILENGTEYFLTGKARGKQYSFPFDYTTGRITCLEGHEYTLKVDYEDFHVEATTIVPYQCFLDTIFAQEVSPGSYKIIAVPSFDDKSNAVFFVLCDNTGGDFQFTRQTRNGRGEIEIFKPLQQGNGEVNQYFHEGEEITIRYTNMQPEGRRFWNSYDEVLTLSRNYFLPYSHNIDSNIHGGSGFWLGYHSSYYQIVLSRQEESLPSCGN